jgi:hypothetical protein
MQAAIEAHDAAPASSSVDIARTSPATIFAGSTATR